MAALTSDSGYTTTDVLLNERTVGLLLVGQTERFDNTRVVGRSIPSGGEVRLLTFSGVTASEKPLSSTSLIRTLRDFFSGSPVRVYRDSAVTTAWSTSNTMGYSDIVVYSISDTTFNWYTTITRRGRFVLKGMECN